MWRVGNKYDKVLVDIAVAHPTTAKAKNIPEGGCRLPLDYSKANPFLAGTARHAQKLQHNAADTCAQFGFDFLPFILETTGAIHPNAAAFLYDLAFRVAERRVSDPMHITNEKKWILRRWKFQFSTLIRKAHARAILDRLDVTSLFAY